MWEAELKRLGDLMTRLHARAGLGSRALGVPEWDWQLSRIGRGWLAAHDDSQPQLQSNDHEPGYARRPDVYLATQVYDLGGHTALIGDFVRALDGTPTAGEQAGASSTLILTDLYKLNSAPVSEAI